MTRSLDDARRRPANAERVPPHNLDAETAVLGAMLVTPAAIAAALDVVAADDFYRPAHGHIFETVTSLYLKGEATDGLTVTDQLRRRGLLETVGGASVLTDLAADTPATGSAARYGRIVAEYATVRRLVGVAGEIAEMGYDGPDDLAGKLDRARDMLAALRSGGGGALVIRTFVDIEAEQVDWLWQGRIPRGMVTIAAGDPGVGKSFVMVALSAGLSVGAALPGEDRSRQPTGSLLVSYEDAAGVTLKQRLAACGADERMVHNLDGVVDGVGLRPFRPDDARHLERELERRPDVGLVVVDPVGSLLAGKLDTSRDNEVRGALLPLVDMARRTNTAVVAVMHLRKEDAQRVIYRVGGSVGGFVGLARSVLLLGREQQFGRRALAHAKCNVGPESPSVEYIIDEAGRFMWKGVADDLGAETLLAAGERHHTKLGAAVAWLLDRLDAGPVLRSQVVADGDEHGFSFATLRRAYDEIGADSVQHGVPGKLGKGPSYWFLPDQLAQAPK
jgi:replicative DNA helicase